MQISLSNQIAVIVELSVGLPDLVLPHLIRLTPHAIGDDVDFERAFFTVDGQPHEVAFLIDGIRLSLVR